MNFVSRKDVRHHAHACLWVYGVFPALLPLENTDAWPGHHCIHRVYASPWGTLTEELRLAHWLNKEHAILCCETLFPKFQSMLHGHSFTLQLEWTPWSDSERNQWVCLLGIHSGCTLLMHLLPIKGTNHAKGLQKCAYGTRLTVSFIENIDGEIM